ncbi:MAG: AsmA family protein [Rhodanobacter sp.]
MRRSVKTVSWIAAVLALLLAATVLFIATFNWNRLRPWLGDRVSQAMGRTFAINGDLSVDWRRDRSAGWWRSLVPWPQFTARDVTIANPDWASGPRFAQLDALRFELSPLPLLAHRIHVPIAQLINPTLDLQRDKDGRATWTFAPAHADQPSKWNLDLGAIGFEQGQITLDDAITRTKLDIKVEPLQQAIPYDQIVAEQSDAARKQAQKTAGAAAKKTLATRAQDKEIIGKADRNTTYQFQWTAKGSYRGVAANGKGKTGSILAMQQTRKALPVQADVQLGDSHIALVGTLTDPMHLGALDVRLWFSGSSMAKLYPFTGLTLPDTSPYTTEGHLTATLGDTRQYSYRDFRGHVGGSDLSGDLDFVTGGKNDANARAKLSGTVASRVLQFADLAPLIGAGSNAARQERGDASQQPADKVLPVAPFRTERWRTMDADVKFTAARIVYKDPLPIDALSTHLVMRAGTLTLDPLHVSLAGGSANGNLKLDGSKTPMHGALKLSARHLKLKQLFPTFEPMKTSFGEINGDTSLTATGNSVAALLGSSNGGLKLLMNDGAISKALLETAGLNVGNIILAKLFGDKTVKINCAATDLAAKDGVYDVRLFVFDTGDAVINMDGTINLATERLDLDVQPHTRGLRILSLRSPLYVKGTLKNPDVGVQKGPLLLRGAGAAALATVAAPAAALLALIAPSHDNDEDNTCHVVLDQMRQSGTLPSAEKAKAKAKVQAAAKG